MTESSRALFFIGIVCRIGLLKSGLFGLAERPELATPLNAHKRLLEGIRLAEIGLDPYSGVLFHETPLALKIFSFLYENFSEYCVHYVYVFGDIFTAFILGRVADLVAVRLLKQQEQDVKKYHPDAREDLLISTDLAASMSSKVQVVF